jgi:hypothetical protein
MIHRQSLEHEIICNKLIEVNLPLFARRRANLFPHLSVAS